MRKKKVYFVIAFSASVISIWGLNESYQKLCEPGYIACLCAFYLSSFFLIRSVIRFATNERMKLYNINLERSYESFYITDIYGYEGQFIVGINEVDMSEIIMIDTKGTEKNQTGYNILRKQEKIHIIRGGHKDSYHLADNDDAMLLRNSPSIFRISQEKYINILKEKYETG